MIVILLICFIVTYFVLTMFFSKKEHHYYTKDNLLNSQNYWYWEWDKDKVKTLHTKCSKCSALLVYDENFNNNTVHFYCPICHSSEMTITGGNYKYSLFIIEREIKRKAKVGKYSTYK